MQLFLLLLICVTLFYMAWQDFVSRAIDWFLYPMVASCIILNGLTINGLLWNGFLVNLLFILMQLLLIAIYFKVVRGAELMRGEKLLGWGDVLFFGILTLALSPVNFFVFYLLSLSLTLIIFFIWQQVKTQHLTVPLAGSQAFCLAILLLLDYKSLGWSLYDDSLLLKFFSYGSLIS